WVRCVMYVVSLRGALPISVAYDQHLAAEGQVGAFNERLQVFGGAPGELDEIQFLVDQLLQPATEGVGAAFLMEEAPGLVRLAVRSEEHTSELQSLENFVCR